MNEEDAPDSAVAVTLEQLEQRLPQLADLQSRRFSKALTRSRKSPLLSADTGVPTASSASAASPEQDDIVDKWVQSHYERISEKLTPIFNSDR